MPERWLETSSPDNNEELVKMHQHLMPFGLGSRTCVGQSLAMLVLRVAVASIVRNFDIVAPPETNQKTMAIVDSLVSICGTPFWILISKAHSGHPSRCDGLQAKLLPPRFIIGIR